ncbi:hypothetical protein [Oceanicola sp. 22II-s10i]|uniref:hypothetical protein n=1 Tax=Oceanicola sp. 22II-s10i TaxID=1317116 RepID=UPI001596095E|nr:hypothetical protein [Oceanicola sp. 22II-s10i]
MLRLIVTALVLILPSATLAQASCSEKHQAQNCAEGYVWSADTQSCVQQITS